MKNFVNKIYHAECLEILKKIPSKSIDLIFADPPYNLQLRDTLYRPDQSEVEAVNESWDKFSNFTEYDDFTKNWLTECKRLLKDGAAIWVIGSYHNILRVGKIMQDLNLWILNDIIWHKTNPMPNFKGTRFTNAHETLLWATTSRKSKYTFNYQSMKTFNEDKQMRSDWYIPICSGKERLRSEDNTRLHPTQKPEALLKRILLSTTNPGDIILDPFLGSGTSTAVAKKIGRNYIGIEKEKNYYDLAKLRLKNTLKLADKDISIDKTKKELPKVPFGELVEQGLIPPGSFLTDSKNKFKARVKIDGSIATKDYIGSIHKVGASVQNLPSCNGWDYWYIKSNKKIKLIDSIRTEYRSKKIT